MTKAPPPEKKSLSIKTLVLLYSSVLLLFGAFYFYADLQMAKNSTALLVKEALKEAKKRAPLVTLSPWQKAALLRVVDPAFESHEGIDKETPGVGAQTLTESLVETLFFRGRAPLFGGLKRWLIARFALHPRVSKAKQLKLFANLASFGSYKDKPVRGFGQASQLLKKKPFAQLSKQEFLSLLAMLLDPSRYHVLTQPKANQGRVKRIQKLLAGGCKPSSRGDVMYRDCQ